MNRINYLLLGSLMIFSGISCGKTECGCVTGQLDYMVFGHFYGECAGEGCVEIFKMDRDQLYEDTRDNYPGSSASYEGTFIALPNEKYELAKDLMDQFPSELYQEENNVIGMPDAGDWGGIYIEVAHDGGAPQFWLLDQMESNMPEIYNVFVDKINEKIALINQ